jgi:hypothetical protein
VGFNSNGTFSPLSDWSNKVPGLDNGEWFWALYGVATALDSAVAYASASGMVANKVKMDVKLLPQATSLAVRYRAYVNCQKQNAKTIFYRGDGMVSAVATIADAFAAPTADNYSEESGYLNDPYEGETMTQML